jgi:hypothetical protein
MTESTGSVTLSGELIYLSPKGKRLPKQQTSDDDVMSILDSLRTMIDELVTDMQQVQWRLVKLERQFGSAGKSDAPAV